MLVTFRFKDTDILHCDDLEAFTFKLNENKKELEVYKDGKFLGNYIEICGIAEDDFIKYVNDSQVEVI